MPQKTIFRLAFLKFLVFILTFSPASAATIYVDDAPGSLNLGTLADPYSSIQTALNVAGPGDVIQVRDGTYNEKLWWANSGTSGNPITLRNFPGETPILTGAGITNQEQMIIISSKSFIVVDGITMSNNYMQEARGIHVFGEGSDIIIQNCIITQMGFTADKTTDPTSVSPTGQAHGILINGRTTSGYTNISILNNELSCLVTGNSESLTLVGNVSDFTISGNSIFDNTNIGIDIAGHFTWAIEVGVSPTLNQARNGIVSSNLVYGNRRFNNTDAPAGIYVDGGKDVVIECNTAYQNGNGISIGCENAGQTASGIIVRNNFIYDNDNHGIVFGSNAADITNCIVRNNTCLKNGNTVDFTSEISLQNSTNCQILNNILYARSISHYSIGIFAYTANTMTVSNNIMFREGGDLSNLIVAGNGSTVPTDVNTLQADPLLESSNLPNPDLHLMESSPALNAGSNINIDMAEEDIDKEPRISSITVDIGADEIQTALPVLYSQSLQAVANDTYITLLWTTTEEINASHFVIEKSANQRTWRPIGEIPSGLFDYQFKDQSPKSGMQYYRLIQVDWDGRHDYTPIVSVKWRDQISLIYPNPSIGTINIEGDYQKWELYQQNGQFIKSGNLPFIDNLRPGVYILNLLSPSSSETKQILIR